MIDAIAPDGEAAEALRRALRPRTAARRCAKPSPDLSNASQIAPMVLPTIMKATQGRQHPRAPFVALEVVTQGRDEAVA